MLVRECSNCFKNDTAETEEALAVVMANHICEQEEDFCCDAKAPKKIEFGFSHFAGMYRATCKKCSYVNSYFECACELRHDCEEN